MINIEAYTIHDSLMDEYHVPGINRKKKLKSLHKCSAISTAGVCSMEANFITVCIALPERQDAVRW